MVNASTTPLVTTVACGSCGATLPMGADAVPRQPCPQCGGTRRDISASIVAISSVSASLSVALTPRDQSRDWRRRLAEAERDLDALSAAHEESLSGDAITAAAHHLHAFFVQTYHLKDALIQDAAATGVVKSAIETAVSTTPAFALLADLANLDKHGKLGRPPRSGHVPKVISVSGDAHDDHGWHLNMVVEHNGVTLDGLQIAADALSAWQSALRGWGLR